MPASEGGIGQPSKVVGGIGGEIMSVRAGLSREAIFGLIVGKELIFCFQLDNDHDEVGSSAKRTFSDVISKGSASSSESLKFPMLVGSIQATKSEEFPVLDNN